MKLYIRKFLLITFLTTLIVPANLKAQVKDIEGNTYKICKIGSHELMAENLATATFNNGDKIPEAKTSEEWLAAGKNKTPAWCYYDNDPGNGKKYGKLYNIYAFNDSRKILPAGWKPIAFETWPDLKETLGYENFWTRLKSVSGWKDKNGDGNAGTNETGFNLLSGGYRGGDGSFGSLGIFTNLWMGRPHAIANDEALGIGFKMKSWFMYSQEIPRNYPFGAYIRGEKDLSVEPVSQNEFYGFGQNFESNKICSDVNKIIAELGKPDKSALLSSQKGDQWSSPKLTITQFLYPSTLTEKDTYTSYTAYLDDHPFGLPDWHTTAMGFITKVLQECLNKKPMIDAQDTHVFLMNNGMIELGKHPATKKLLIRITVTK